MITLNAFSCMNNHIVYCPADLSAMVCPLCLGKVKHDKDVLNSIILSPAQGSISVIDEEDL